MNKSIALLKVDSVVIEEIRGEFIPDWLVHNSQKCICPICLRPHHKEPGPFMYGMTLNKKKETISLWVQSFGCCRTEQYFPLGYALKREINPANIISIIKKVFSHK